MNQETYHKAKLLRGEYGPIGSHSHHTWTEYVLKCSSPNTESAFRKQIWDWFVSSGSYFYNSILK